MGNVNWGKFVLGALIVAAICFVSDGFLHQRVVNEGGSGPIGSSAGTSGSPIRPGHDFVRPGR